MTNAKPAHPIIPPATGTSFVPMAGTHDPVLLAEVLSALNIRDGKTYVDGTLGLGGYTRAILESANCRVIAIDRDPAAIAAASAWADPYGDRLTLIQGCFGDMSALLPGAVDGITLDLGVSSPQLDMAERGFSFRMDGPLDMRMEGITGGRTAADIVNTASEEEIADILFQYGEERASRRIARAIVAARKQAPITRTMELANLVRKVLGRGDGRIDPATRSFQGLRIAVNDELGEITRALDAAPGLLLPGGRLAIVSFHSLEDRLVKNALRQASGGEGNGSRHLPGQSGPAPLLKLISRKPVLPGRDECTRNPRARSSRLRIAEKLAPVPQGGAA